MRVKELTGTELSINIDHVVKVRPVPEEVISGHGNTPDQVIHAHALLTLVRGDDIKIDCDTGKMLAQLLALKVTATFVVNEKTKEVRRR